MQLVKPILFWTSRVLTVLITSVGYLFLLLSTQPTYGIKQPVSITVAILTISGIVYLAYHQRNSIVLSLAPLGILAGFWMYFFLGGFVSSFGFVPLLFSSLLISILLALSFYSWTNNISGGITYISLGVFYFLISYTRVPTLTLIIVAGIIIATGVLLTLSSTQTENQQDNS